MKFSIKNMKFSIKNMKFSIYEVRQNSSFFLFVTEFSYHMYRKNAFLYGKQKQMKPLIEYELAVSRCLGRFKLELKHYLFYTVSFYTTNDGIAQ